MQRFLEQSDALGPLFREAVASPSFIIGPILLSRLQELDRTEPIRTLGALRARGVLFGEKPFDG